MPSIADVVDLVGTALGGGIPVFFGQEYVAENRSPPRVVFVPSSDRYEAPAARDRAMYPSPSIRTRAAGVMVHVWGAADPAADPMPSWPELRATELLVDKVVMAIYGVAGGAVEFEGGDWAETSVAQQGRLYTLRARFKVPVVPTVADSTSQTTTFTEVLSPNQTALGDPADPAIRVTLALASDVTGVPSP